MKYKFYRLLLLIGITIFSFCYFFSYLYNKINIKLNNEAFINYLTNDTLGINNITDIASLNSMQYLFKYSFGIDLKKNNEPILNPIINENNTNIEPIIYIYNTHQKEEYKTNFSDTFNINNSVLIASYILKEYLADLGINAIVENNSISDILNRNNWAYGASYKASRIFLEQAKINNPSLMYFIDIHRDSSSYESTVTNIDGKEYARLLFVIGLENPNYQKNLANTGHLEALIKQYNNSLSRGIMQKQGKGVNGVYNQDFNEQTFLIEIGGQYNNIEQISNTLKVLAQKLYEYINEDQNG